jgi:hypothetical protein
VPDSALAPPEAAAIQSEGNVRVARTVPELAAAQLAGAAPVLIVRIGAVPIVDSIWSNRAFLTLVDNCKAIKIS